MSAPTAVLPDELWAKIFVELEGGVRHGLGESFRDFPDRMAEAQSELHQLRLVCRKFNDVIKAHPRLSRCLVLPPALNHQSLPSLLAWLQQHAASVEILAAYCDSPCPEAALAKLLPPQTLLDDVFLSQCSSRAVALMSRLNLMTQCELSTPTDVIDLSPLKELTKLQKLHLSHGNFQAAGLPANLTNLTVEGSHLFVRHNPLGCSYVSSLQKLQLYHGYLSGLHPSGLLACSAVEQLQLIHCSIGADDKSCWVDSSCLPTGFSALTSLSSLTVTFGPTVPENNLIDLGVLHALPLLQNLVVQSEGMSVNLRVPAELGAFQNLTSLTLSAPVWDHQRLAVQSEGMSVNLRLPAELGALQNLTSLTLRAPVWDYQSENVHSGFPVVSIDVQWDGMHALQCLKVHNLHFSCSSSMLALTTLSHLSEITFEDCTPVGIRDEESSFTYLHRTMQQIVRHCPHVKLVCDEELIA